MQDLADQGDKLSFTSAEFLVRVYSELGIVDESIDNVSSIQVISLSNLF